MNEKPMEIDNRKPAGFFSRMLAFLLDLFLITFLGLMIGLVIFLVLHFFNYEKILNFVGSLVGVKNPFSQFITLISPILFLVVLIYFVFFWALVGFTPGKALFGLQIVRQDGQQLSVRRALLRYLGYWVSAIPLFLGFIWVLFDRQHEGWHDKISRTHVMYNVSKYPKRKE